MNDSGQVETGYYCYPPSWDEVVPGYSLEKDTITIFGSGFVDKSTEYRTGRIGRIYLDPSKSLKLIFTTYVNVAESRTITSLVDEGEKINIRSRHESIKMRALGNGDA
jgi:hypothetical protein